MRIYLFPIYKHVITKFTAEVVIEISVIITDNNEMEGMVCAAIAVIIATILTIRQAKDKTVKIILIRIFIHKLYIKFLL